MARGRKKKRRSRPKKGSIVAMPKTTRTVADKESVPLRRGEQGKVGKLASGSGMPADETAAVTRDIARHDYRSALDRAKRIHKQCCTDESEALLIGAYHARLWAMLESGLVLEASELIELLERRYSSARSRFGQLYLALAARGGRLDELVGDLAKPDLAAQQRQAIELVIRREVTDMSALATCRALPEDHPWRLAASAVVKAFEAVTSGIVDDAVIALGEVSRRSPLADWKLLIRAIACFYRRDDQGCMRLVDMIEDKSAAARLVPGLRAMLAGENAAALKPQVGKLVEQVLGSSAALRRSLENLDRELARNKQHEVPARIRRAVSDCERERPELLVRLKQHISVRCSICFVPVAKVEAALGGPARHDAYFWRLYAQAMSEVHHEACLACTMWEEFRRNALCQGWFKEKSPEEAAVYLHMIDLLRRVSEESLDDIRDKWRGNSEHYGPYYDEGQPAEVLAAAPAAKARADNYFLYPEQLYERAAACQADSGVFRQWLAYLKDKDATGKAMDEVALRWCEALPEDSEPLLHLMMSAEKRNAFNKALKYLQKAEQIDAVNPEVKRARLRLCVFKAIRHLKQEKIHLAEKDYAEIAALPMANEGDRPACLAGLRWAGAVLGDDAQGREKLCEQVGELLGDVVAGAMVLMMVGQNCDSIVGNIPSLDKKVLKRKIELVAATARVCALGDEMGMPFWIPEEWQSRLIKGLAKKDCRLDAMPLRRLGEAAWRSDQADLLFAVSGAGLRQSGPLSGRFMLLRAQSLAGRSLPRMRSCLAAAAELARRQSDGTLLSEIVDYTRSRNSGWSGYGWGRMDMEDLNLTDEKLAEVIEQEEKAKKLPKFSSAEYYGDNSFDDEYDDSPCDCPACRRRRGETRTPRKRKRRVGPEPEMDATGYLFDNLFDDDDGVDCEDEGEQVYGDDGFDGDDDGDEGIDFSPGSMASDMIEVVMEIMMKTGGRLPDMDEIDELTRDDPDLRVRVMRVLAAAEKSGLPDFDDDDLPIPGGFKLSGRSRARTKRRGRKR